MIALHAVFAERRLPNLAGELPSGGHLTLLLSTVSPAVRSSGTLPATFSNKPATPESQYWDESKLTHHIVRSVFWTI